MKRLISLILIVMMLLTAAPVKAEDQHPLLDSTVSDAAIVLDRDTGQILDEKNAEEKIYPASMTKMMTAILAIENLPDLNQKITITSEMLAGLLEANASTAGFQVGDTPTVQDLLYGIALPSGADAANAVSYTITGSQPQNFIAMMNQKAQEIGMTSTHFVNTTGLHDPDHYSTVHDMARLLKYCLSDPTFQTVFSAHTYQTSPLASAPQGLSLRSSMWSAAQRGGIPTPGLIGGKTGYTESAGHCLACWADVNNMHLIIVTAHADTPMYERTHLQDASRILNSLQSWSRETVARKRSVIARIKVHHPFHEETIPVKAPETVRLDLPADARTGVSFQGPLKADVSNAIQYISGTMQVSSDAKVLYEKKIQVQIPPEENFFARIILWFESLFH